MKQWLAVLPLTLLMLLPLLLNARDDKPRTDKTIFDELRMLADLPADLRDENDDEKKEKERIEQIKKRAESVFKLLQELETKHAKSPLLVGAYVQTITLLDNVSDGSMVGKSSDLAQALLKVADKGSDAAALADLTLLSQETQKIFKEARTAEALKTAWKTNAESLRKRIVGYLAAYPKYRPGADSFEQLIKIAEFAGDSETPKLVMESVAKNLPDHDLAKSWKREQAIGKEFEFEFTPLGGKKTAVKELRGKVVLIDFWATWCGPCVREMPRLKDIYDKNKEKGFEIVGISLDDNAKDVEAFAKEKKIAWLQVHGKDANDLADRWGITGIPTMFLIDKQGNLRSIRARAELEELLPKLLAEK